MGVEQSTSNVGIQEVWGFETGETESTGEASSGGEEECEPKLIQGVRL